MRKEANPWFFLSLPPSQIHIKKQVAFFIGLKPVIHQSTCGSVRVMGLA